MPDGTARGTFLDEHKVEAPTNQVTPDVIDHSDEVLHKISQQKIFYIEDNPASRELIKTLLEDYPHIELLTASTAEQGIEIAQSQLPELLFIDIDLPNISGISAVKILKQDPNLSNAKMYALSADVLPDQIDKGMAAGFDAYLTKPVEIRELIRVIEEAVPIKQ